MHSGSSKRKKLTSPTIRSPTSGTYFKTSAYFGSSNSDVNFIPVAVSEFQFDITEFDYVVQTKLDDLDLYVEVVNMYESNYPEYLA